MHFLTRSITKKTLASILVVFLMVPASLLVLPQKSEASINALIGAGAGTVGCFIANGLNNMVQAGMNALTTAFPSIGLIAGAQTMVPVDPIPSGIRECSLDAIVWAFINDLIAGILRDMVVWVESGFKGTPGFVSNIGGFVLGTAQHTFDRFIDENLAFLCEPFQFNIGLTLTRLEVTTRAERFSCTLDGIVGNVDNFLSGGFADGGWDGFVTLNTTRGGSPLSLLIDSNLSIMGMQELQLERELNILDWGRGFFSTPDEDGDLITPGVVIEDQLNHVLGAPQRRIEVADDVNELIDALIARFVTDLFGAGAEFAGLISGDGSPGWAADRANAYFDITARREALLAEIDEIIALAEEAENEEILEAAQQLREDVLALNEDDPDVMHQLFAYERMAGYLRAMLAANEIEPLEIPELDVTFPAWPSTGMGPLPAFSCATNDYTTAKSGRQVTVNSSEGLVSALRSAQAGDVIVLGSGTYNLNMRNQHYSDYVTIQGSPGAVVRTVFLTDVTNLQFEGVNFVYGDATGHDWQPKIIELHSSENIRIVGNTIVGNPNASRYNCGSGCSSDIPNTGVRALGSKNIVIANNQFSKITRMTVFQHTNGWIIENNTFTDIGCDGNFFQHSPNGAIHSNYYENVRPFIYAAQGSTCHGDFIQFDEGKGRLQPEPPASSNLSIQGNVMLQGQDGSRCAGPGQPCGAMQGIFLEGATGGDHLFRNVTIANNVYCASGINGLYINNSQNATITNNAHYTCPPPFGSNHTSNIILRGDQSGSVATNNETGRVSGQNEAIQRAKAMPGLNNCIIDSL